MVRTSTVRGTSAMLYYRLSLVLDLVDLSVGQTVLDFGAGSSPGIALDLETS